MRRTLVSPPTAPPATVLARHLRTAAKYFQQALTLMPADAVTDWAVGHNQLGLIYAAGQAEAALSHYQKSIDYEEAAGDRYGAGQTRGNIAILLAGAGRQGDALAS